MISCQMRIKQRFGNFLKPVQNKDMKQGLKKGIFSRGGLLFPRIPQRSAPKLSLFDLT